MDLFIYGAVGAGAIFAYLVATRGLPAAWATVKAWASKGKAELALLKGDVADAHAKADGIAANLAAAEQKLTQEIGEIKARLDRAGVAV